MKNLLKWYNESMWVEKIMPVSEMYWDEENEWNYSWEYSECVLDELPTFQPFRIDVQIGGTRKLVERSGHKRYYSACWYCDKAQSIMNGSVGMPADKLYSKVRPILAKCKEYGANPYKWFLQRLDRARIVGGHKYYVNEYGRWDGGNRYRWYGHKYIDIDGIIKEKPYKRSVPRVYDARKHYARVTERKKTRKQQEKDRERRAEVVLVMLKDPQLFTYYRSLYQKKQDILGSMRWRWDDKMRRDKWWRKWHDRQDKETKKRLEAIEEELYHLESKQFNVFYSSKLYRYSLQKECHHFANIS